MNSLFPIGPRKILEECSGLRGPPTYLRPSYGLPRPPFFSCYISKNPETRGGSPEDACERSSSGRGFSPAGSRSVRAPREPLAPGCGVVLRRSCVERQPLVPSLPPYRGAVQARVLSVHSFRPRLDDRAVHFQGTRAVRGGAVAAAARPLLDRVRRGPRVRGPPAHSTHPFTYPHLAHFRARHFNIWYSMHSTTLMYLF